ncbi:MAG: iron-containing alcohol dehydrogenase, partial [Oricola sp.]|nr:iron-containing alcohol dehydrogenase [Oricola sp.]
DLRTALSTAGITTGLFDRLQGNPTAKNLEDGIAAFREGGHDSVIAIGGGSALDIGKTIAFMAGQTRPVWDFEDVGDCWRRADSEAIAPVIAIPTTSGTGSEVGRATVIADDRTHEKKIIFHPLMMPRIVIADPALTIGLPEPMTVGTGMDALAHNLEAFCALSYHPMADAIAVDGIRLLQRWLPVAAKDGENVEARAHVMAAASMGGTSFQKGLGAIHSLSHPIGSILGLHHGMTNAVLLPYVIDYNRPAIGEKMEHLAYAMRLDGAGSGVDRFIAWATEFRKQLGVPHTLAEFDVRPEHFGKIAKMSVSDPTAGTNPVALTVEGSTQILQAAYEGKLSTP